MISELRDLTPSERQTLHEIHADVGMFNDLCQSVDYWDGLTFQVGITPQNHAAAVRNAEGVHMLLAQRATLLAERIAAFCETHRG